MGGCWVGALAPTASLPPQTNRPITYCLPLRRNTTLLSLSRLPLPQQSLVVLSENDRIVMCWPKHLLVNRDGAQVQWLGFLILALICIEVPQIVEPGCQVGVLWPYRLLSNRDGALIECFCLGPLALCLLVHVLFEDSLHKAGDGNCG